MRIVALSLTEPWAVLMPLGAKKVETRSWRTSYRGWVAIHASKVFPKDARDLAVEEDYFFSALFLHGGYESVGDLPLGAIVAVGRLVGCRPTEELRIHLSEQERAFGDYSPGRWAWIFEDVHRLPEPIPANGSRRLWTPEPAVHERLEEFVRGIQS